MINTDLFLQQLADLSIDIDRFDVFGARYQLDYQHTAKYIDKLDIGVNLSAAQIIDQIDNLSKLNEEKYNIYLRPHNYLQSRVLILDDFMSPDSIKFIKHAVYRDHIVDKKSGDLIFVLQSSVKNDTNEKNNNYQLGFRLSPDIDTAYKPSVLKHLCGLLQCDEKHANTAKYFRAAGFINQKYWPQISVLDAPVIKGCEVGYLNIERPLAAEPEKPKSKQILIRRI